jgi:hypothetical protein
MRQGRQGNSRTGGALYVGLGYEENGGGGCDKMDGEFEKRNGEARKGRSKGCFFLKEWGWMEPGKMGWGFEFFSSSRATYSS